MNMPCSAKETRRRRLHDPWLWLSYGIFVLITFMAVAHHQPWRDEAQIWTTVRDLDLRGVFGQAPSEGRPPLWEMLVMPLAKVGLPYAAMNWLHWALALVPVFWLLFAAPWPRPLRWLLPFSYYFLFEYSVVARHYVLTVLLVFAIAASYGRRWSDRLPFNLVPLALFGERYVEVRARNSGRLEYAGNMNDQYVLRIGAELYPLWIAMKPDSPFFNPDPDKSMKLRFNLGDRVEAGQIIASGRVRQGDHVFVNKVANNFARPQRGQVVVFDTNYIPEKERLGIRPDSFYIKRLVGLPGETVSIRDRHLVVDGRPVTEPFPFRRLTTDPRYRGYVPRPHSRLPEEGAEIRLGEKQFLPFGDNTYSSLDGRYFGPVSEQALVGPSFFVYWPLGPHWGWSR